MTRKEFERAGEDQGVDFSEITEAEYKEIEFVYQFHPAISEDALEGREQIVTIVGILGMSVIRDMLPRAERAKKVEDDLRSTRIRLSQLKDQYEELKECRVPAE